jgi:hypothetical protein
MATIRLVHWHVEEAHQRALTIEALGHSEIQLVLRRWE